MCKSKYLFLICLLTMTIFFSWGIILIDRNISALTSIYQTNYYKSDIRGNGKDDEALQVKSPLNILILGLDEGSYRSDVIMLMNYEPASGQIKLISVPRDSMVRYKGNIGKINALYSYGKEGLIKNTMELFTGLKIDYYITADLTGFRRLIDTLGGIYINVPINMNYDDPQQNLSIHIRKGYQLLNGRKAEDFIRYRKSSLDNGVEIGDLGRIEMQAYLIKEIFKQKLNIKYISKADEILLTILKNIKTNITLDDIKEYIPYSCNISPENIKSYTVPGQPSLINEVWYYMVDADRTQDIIHNNFSTLQK